MSVSVVIPTFRRGAMLAELLGKLSPQLGALPDAEAIVVDNCPDASARAVVEPLTTTRLRYVHEPRSGVVHARNRGVAEAQGGHIIFLDDDEAPSPGWLASFAAQAAEGVEMASGRIVPRYLGEMQPGLASMLDRTFSREVDAETGADITDRWIYLGTGNSMFRRDCFAGDAPFDARFNRRGGEDIWFIKGLVDRGVRIRWNREALVEEIVPADRMTAAYLKDRKFNQGQLRCVFMLGHKPSFGSRLRVALWMGIGAVQVAGFSAGAALLGLIGSPRREEAAARVHAGLGKLLWWRGAGSTDYVGSA